MRVIKKIEGLYRQVRSYLIPSHYKSASIARSHAVPLPTDNTPLCLFDFTSIKIDNVMGRYLYHLITEFEACGYHIAFVDRHRFLGTFLVKEYKTKILQHNYSLLKKPPAHRDQIVFVTDNAKNQETNFEKKILISYEHHIPVNSSESSTPEIAFPFFVHPTVHESNQVEEFHHTMDENSLRQLRLLFAGNAKFPKYDAPVLEKKYQVLSRYKMLQIAENSLTETDIKRPTSYQQLISESDSEPSFTSATIQNCPIPPEHWIKTIGLADFYLACPGVEMPMCHNLIEALAAGSIPILQYPQYLDPPLTHGKNCLVFNDKQELISAISNALTMNNLAIKTMRANAILYYKQYLQPGAFGQKLTSPSNNESILFLNSYRVPR
ncbi:MAG: hypothetical protein ACSHX0_08150 [Akkermansiaceae bacterium]